MSAVDFVLILAIAAMAIIPICLIGNKESDFKKQAIQRGYAEYNPTNGVWQWKEAK